MNLGFLQPPPLKNANDDMAANDQEAQQRRKFQEFKADEKPKQVPPKPYFLLLSSLASSEQLIHRGGDMFLGCRILDLDLDPEANF